MKHIAVKIALCAGIASLALAPLALAQQPTPVLPPTTQGPITSVGGAGGVIPLLNKILTWIGTIFWIAAAIFVLYAGFLYLTAGGDPEKVGKANHQLIYAIVAIVIGIMAFGLPKLIDAFLRGQ